MATEANRRTHLVAALTVTLGASVALAPGRLAAQAADRLTRTPMSTELDDATSYAFERGVLRVPQNRANPDGPVFELEFYRFPALAGADPDTPPIFHLNGGPGWPGLGNRPQHADWLVGNVFPRAQHADLVFVGQRGIGSSGPNTVCGAGARPGAGASFDRAALMRAAVEAARACRSRWEAEGVDLSGITVIEAAADVRDVAVALGYERIQVHGASFGSHWGMAVMRFHPEIVARALLGGMEGPDHTYDMPGWILAALERMAADAEASGVFEGRLPEGGILAGFRRTIAEASREPIEVSIPDGSAERTVVLGPDDVRGLWEGYTPSGGGHPARYWASDMIRLAEGDRADAARAVLRDRFALSRLPTAAFFMFDCGSGISGPRLERLLSDPAADVVGRLGRFYETLCPVWDADLGETFRAGFDTDIPTVIVHGDWDLSTPLENALELRPHFLNHTFVRVERGTHGAVGEALRHSEAFRAALDAYMATGDRSGFPDTVSLPIDWAPLP